MGARRRPSFPQWAPPSPLPSSSLPRPPSPASSQSPNIIFIPLTSKTRHRALVPGFCRYSCPCEQGRKIKITNKWPRVFGFLGIQWDQRLRAKSLSRVQLFVTPWTVAHQAPQSMEFSRQEYWSGLPFPSPGDLPDPGIKPGSPALQADALPSEPQIWSIKSLQGECLLLFNLLHACQVTTVMSDSCKHI